MTTKYVAQWLGGGGSIRTVEVERETAESVWVNGRRLSKNSSWEWYRDTWQEAHAILLNLAQCKVSDARRSLQHANDVLGNVNGMKPPKDAA